MFPLRRVVERRSVLRGLGVSVALPFLDAMRPRQAQAAGLPEQRRMIFWYTPNGQDLKYWTPTGKGKDFVLSPHLAPLEAIRKDLLLPTNLHYRTRTAGANGHNFGIATALTGTGIAQDGGLATVNNEVRGYAVGPSVDYVISRKAPGAAQLKAPLLVLGSQTRGYEFGKRDPYSYVSYAAAGGNNVNGAEESPAAAFKRMFADTQIGSSKTIEDARLRRKSILDFVATRYAPDKSKLVARLGSADKQLIEKHFTAIRELESRINALPVVAGGACGSPGTATATDYRAVTLASEQRLGIGAPTVGECQKDAFLDPKQNASFPDVMRAHTDLSLMALQCGLSRVAVLQNSGAQSGPSHVWACAPGNHHGITHDLANAASRENEKKISLWYASRFVHLIESLRKVRDADGSLLDNTAVLWFSELADAAGHSFGPLPYVIAGSCGGTLKTGELVDCGGRAHNDLLNTLMNAMGIPGTTFGDAGVSKGAIAELRGAVQ